jgi:cytochrome c oxidase cbb3-type subunit 3
MAANLQLQFAEIGELTADRENVVKFLYEENWLQVGKVVFKTHCVSCHGKDGGGLVGPNLCDDSYKNVKDIGDILTVLQKGANAGAMPAWSNRLSTNEIVLASSYVASLRGSSPAIAKPAEGRVIDPWPQAPAKQEEGAAASDEVSESTIAK